MNESRKGSTGFFGVITNPQSYLNIVYLLLAFPLGTFYFVFLVTGLSLGLGLSITVLGLPLLALVLGGSWALCRFEQSLASAMLKEAFPISSQRPEAKGLWSRIKALFKDRATWTGSANGARCCGLNMGTATQGRVSCWGRIRIEGLILLGSS